MAKLYNYVKFKNKIKLKKKEKLFLINSKVINKKDTLTIYKSLKPLLQGNYFAEKIRKPLLSTVNFPEVMVLKIYIWLKYLSYLSLYYW